MNFLFVKAFVLFLFSFSFLTLNAQVNFLQVPFETLVERAQKENKGVFVFLSNNNNESWWMEHNVFNNKAIGDLYNENFVCGIFYGQINYTNLSTKALRVKKYPFMLYYHPVVDDGYRISGGYNEEEVLWIGKSIAKEFTMFNVLSHQLQLGNSNKATTYKIADNDGRYTLGVKGRRLMYGYPYPNSTSHFIVNVDENMASNSPRFLIDRDIELEDYLERKGFFARIFDLLKRKKKKFKLKAYDDVTYLSDTLTIKFDDSNSMHSSIQFRFNGLKIKQILSPLNEFLEPCQPSDSTRYYQVDYIVENDSNKTVNAGILVLFDTMIHGNDAAKMDAFKTDLLEYLTPEQRRDGAKSRGKYAKFKPGDGVKRILVYETKELTKDMTGDFRLQTIPDEVHIGSWPLFYGVLWDVPKIKKGKKYFDSAVILKWNTQPLAPGEKFYYTTIFGLYNKGVLELVPAGTNYSGTDKEGKRVTLSQPELIADPDTIFEGESSYLRWNVENPLNADVYVSAKPRTRQQNQGKIYVQPKSTTTYYLQMLDNGKEIANAGARITVLKRPEKIGFDGKFTIGSKEMPLTFGYPFPYSTSYFQLYYKKKYYSNNMDAGKDIYLQGKQFEDIPENEKNELTYETKDFEIVQKLVPLDINLKKTHRDSAFFYRCEYIIKNLNKSKATYSFRHILDFSSLSSERLQLKLDGNESHFNRSFIAKSVPKNIVISSKSDNYGVQLYPSPGQSQSPISVSVGDWHFLKDMEVKTEYSDSSFYRSPSVLLRLKKTVPGNETVKFAFIIGSNKKSKLKYVYNQSQEEKSAIVNFESNKFKIGSDDATKIIDFIKNNTFDFIVLEGFTDNVGALEKNYVLAKKRIDAIKNILKDAGVDEQKILNKVHGEFFSNQKSKDKEVDDIEERKVKIVLFNRSLKFEDGSMK
jgi:outer membrane protein OmpA-like peptidoglycan-associated protein